MQGSPYWATGTDALLAELRSTPAGLSTGEAASRLQGAERVRLHGPSPLRLLLIQFRSPITLLLAAAAVLSLALSEVTDGLIILGILVASALLGFWQEYRAEGAVAQLLAMIETRATVLRDGKPVDVPADAVVPGDVVLLSAGSAIPGDARLLEAKDLFVDEAVLTGESFPAEKDLAAVQAEAEPRERSNSVFQGTHVVSGTGSALVARTGRQTLYGEIAERLALRPRETEFERGVRRFGYLLMNVALLLALVIFAINVALARPVLDAFLFTLALVVGLTPQLLPAIVSVTLSQGARHMAREQVIVRRLGAIEDLGGMTVLCADKTGTLTEGVVRLEGAYHVDGEASERVHLLASLNAAFETGFANPLDQALRAVAPAEVAGYEKLDEVPYDFTRKRLSVAVRRGEERLLVTKGAVAQVLEICSAAERPDGRKAPIADVRPAVQARFEALSRDGLRCLAVAYRPLEDDGPVDKSAERDMVLAGLIAFADPPKEGAVDGLNQLRALGISLKLVTGDNRHVAARIAADTGLEAGTLLTGADLRPLSGAALVRAVAATQVFAEVEPLQKEGIILALKKAGVAVGYLGDGINDASALHAADVGISVDTAVDVTRQAADVVLLRKDLRVLGQGVREGRRAFANTLKYIFITTSANFGNMFSMAGASLFASFLPLLPKQVLLINALTDLPAMAIATDRLDPEQTARPRRWNLGYIRSFMLTFGLASSAFDFLTFGALLALGTSTVQFRTGWFVESVISELLVLLVVRTRRFFLKSPVGRGLFWISFSVALTTLILPLLPVGGALGFGPISPTILIVIAGILIAYTLASELVKRAFFRRRGV